MLNKFIIKIRSSFMKYICGIIFFLSSSLFAMEQQQVKEPSFISLSVPTLTSSHLILIPFDEKQHVQEIFNYITEKNPLIPSFIRAIDENHNRNESSTLNKVIGLWTVKRKSDKKCIAFCGYRPMDLSQESVEFKDLLFQTFSKDITNQWVATLCLAHLKESYTPEGSAYDVGKELIQLFISHLLYTLNYECITLPILSDDFPVFNEFGFKEIPGSLLTRSFPTFIKAIKLNKENFRSVCDQTKEEGCKK
jgi:hypothetical protein